MSKTHKPPQHIDLEAYEKELRAGYTQISEKLMAEAKQTANTDYLQAQIMGNETSVQAAVWLAKMSNTEMSIDIRLRAIAFWVANFIKNASADTDDVDQTLALISMYIAEGIQRVNDGDTDVVKTHIGAPTVIGGNA